MQSSDVAMLLIGPRRPITFMDPPPSSTSLVFPTSAFAHRPCTAGCFFVLMSDVAALKTAYGRAQTPVSIQLAPHGARHCYR